MPNASALQDVYEKKWVIDNEGKSRKTYLIESNIVIGLFQSAGRKKIPPPIDERSLNVIENKWWGNGRLEALQDVGENKRDMGRSPRC